MASLNLQEVRPFAHKINPEVGTFEAAAKEQVCFPMSEAGQMRLACEWNRQTFAYPHWDAICLGLESLGFKLGKHRVPLANLGGGGGRGPVHPLKVTHF